MAFGTGAVTTAVIGGAIAGGVGVGGGLLGGLLGGGGGTKLNSKAIKDSLKAYQARVGELAAQLKAETAAITAAGKGEVKAYADEFRGFTDAEEEVFLERLQELNNSYIDSVTALSNIFPQEVELAIQNLGEATDALNKGSREDTIRQLEGFLETAGALDERLREESDASIDEFLQTQETLTSDYQADADRIAGRVRDESMSLGDRFLSESEKAFQRFDQAATFSPEFLTQANRAADELSKGALQTRMDLLATADPRALELSAIADENAAALMSGRISSDVQANLARSSAMQALQGGFGASSEMGRGLAARDLGLTSLDLMQQGTVMNEAQRRLNYDTRVAGTQVNPFDVSNQMLNAERDIFSSRLGVAQSDRDQRLRAVQDEGSQQLTSRDNVFGSRMAGADTVRGQRMTVGQNLYNSNLDVSRDVLRTSLANTSDIYNNMFGLAGTVFNARTGTAEKVLNTGLGLSSDLFRTNTSAAGAIYDAKNSRETNIFSGKTTTTNNAMGLQAAAAIAAMQAEATAAGGAAQGGVSLALQQMMVDQGNRQAAANLWGSAIQSGVSMAGSYLGSQNWNTMGGRGYSSPGAAAQAAPFAQQISYTRGTGYVPMASPA